MTASAGPVLKRLYKEFGDRVGFATLYVREAHPGERYPQPTTFERKMEHARAYKTRDEIPWPVAVDDVEGSLHRLLDPKPNAAYVVDSNGIVVLRSLWSNYDPALRDGLEAVTAGAAPKRAEHEPRVVPMLRGVGRMDEILAFAGGYARTDVLRAAPPVYGMARMAGMFRPLPPLARTTVAMAVILGALVAIAAAARRVSTDRP
jgi:hypothetical protein